MKYIVIFYFTFALGLVLELSSVPSIPAKSIVDPSPHKMLIEEEDAAELKTWVVKRLENMYVRIHC